jgi:pyrimidine and pyridine-specific 5'-nucleotidase
MSLKVTSFSLVDEGGSEFVEGPPTCERNSPSPNGRSKSNTHFIQLTPLHSTCSDAPVYFFDLDNTLYPKSSGIDLLMARRIELFFETHLSLPQAESKRLGARFYRDYGLAIKGLIKHFSIDPVVYDEFVDGGLQLEEILKPAVGLSSLMDRLSKRGPCWVFTNAGRSHAVRVLKLLDIEKFFSGVIYCDYSETDFPAKPDRLAFARAMKCAQIDDPAKCFFFDDSLGNIRSAQEVGWKVVYIDEDAEVDESKSNMEMIRAFPTIRLIEEVESVLPE